MRSRCLGSALRREGKLSSLILWGPPGSGKTTLARLIAAHNSAEFIALSAVLAGVKDVRAAIEEARKSQRRSRRTILFIDEIHRFNKAQQDALLGAVEDGTITLIGATTENPSFEVNAALLSRCRVVVLEPLDPGRTCHDSLQSTRRPRTRAGAFEPASRTRDDREACALGRRRRPGCPFGTRRRRYRDGTRGRRPRHVTEAALVEALGRARFAYDRQGEDHYNLISALIKSVRNSDASAALYWLARMIEGGADPVFIARRLCILASEDVGLADPQAIVQAAAAAQITHLIGLPEALFPLAQATIYLAQAPKSNLVKRAYTAAAADAAESAREPVPLHLRNAVTSLMKSAGYGQGYRYIHDDPAASAKCPACPSDFRAAITSRANAASERGE